MQTAFAELPLALFTTLAPLGAGAFIALACAFHCVDFDDDQLKKVDRLALVPAVLVLVGFLASAMHLASPLNAFGVFTHLGSSPLSNEVFVGILFVVIMVVCLGLALLGKLNAGGRKAASIVLAIASIVFVCFIGMAYLVDTIASWNTLLVPVQMLGFALLGGAALGSAVLAWAGVASKSFEADFAKVAKILAGLGLALALIGFVGQLVMTSGVASYLVSGAALVGEVMPWAICAVICLVAAAAILFVAAKKPASGVLTGAFVLMIAGVFIARLVFYALQLSVGL